MPILWKNMKRNGDFFARKGDIRMGIRSKIVAKTALTTLYSKTFEAKIFLDVSGYKPTEVNIKDGEEFTQSAV